MNTVEKYFNHLDVLEGITQELLVMHPEDLRFILGIILPMGSDIELAHQEITQWQKLNLDIMKK